MIMREITDPCWIDLADAIVLNAVEDWRTAKLKLALPSMECREAYGVVKSCERFFVSVWFDVLTGLDGRTFLRRLKEGFSFN